MAEIENQDEKSCNLEESQSTGCCCVLFLGPYGETVPLPTLPLSQLPLRPLISGKMLHNFLLSVTTATKTVMAASNDKTTLLVPSVPFSSLDAKAPDTGLMMCQLFESLRAMGYCRDANHGKDGIWFNVFKSETVEKVVKSEEIASGKQDEDSSSQCNMEHDNVSNSTNDSILIHDKDNMTCTNDSLDGSDDQSETV